jgi:hypothetical protein
MNENRREFLAGAVTLASFALPRPARADTPRHRAAAPAGAGPALPVDPVLQNEIGVRLYGTTADGGESLFRTRGIIYAVQPTGVRPLYGMVGSERSWWRRVDSTTWLRFPSTLSFFCDLESGRWLEEYTNPLHGRTVHLPASFIRHKEGEYYTPNGNYFGSMKRRFPETYPDRPLALDWEQVEDVVRIRGTSKFPPILPQPSLEASSSFANARELLDPRTTRAAAHSAGWNIFAWHPYLEMGDAPGHIIWHFDAVKVRGVESLPPDYLARARAFTPAYDSSPESDPGPSFFERILEHRAPRPPNPATVPDTPGGAQPIPGATRPAGSAPAG